jgi:hypothetical protein
MEVQDPAPGAISIGGEGENLFYHTVILANGRVVNETHHGDGTQNLNCVESDKGQPLLVLVLVLLVLDIEAEAETGLEYPHNHLGHAPAIQFALNSARV